MNYTSNDLEHEDSPEEWLACCLCFVGALSFLLKEGEGVAVKVQNDLKQFFPDDEVIVVYSSDNQIKITKEGVEGLTPGQLVWVHDD
jgi:hypothetical protein